MGNIGHRFKIISLVLVAVAVIGAFLFVAAEPAYAGTTTPPPNANSEPVCKGGAMGWVLCPAAEVLKGITEWLAQFLGSLLVTEPLIGPANGQGAAIRAVWSMLIGIANVVLAIAFLIVIFSQATSVGLSSYGIKKMLPRIVVAAILMNLSFYICAFLVDGANIAGQSVKAIMQVGINTVGGIPNLDPAVGTANQTGDWVLFFSALLTAITVAGVTGALPFLLVVLASGAAALLTAFAVLIIRNVLIILLIIVSPLAFAAWVLPNTESWFTRWRKTFIVMLVLYPVIMAVFYGSQLVAVTVTKTTPSAASSDLNYWQENGNEIVAFMVIALPLFALPFILRSMGGVLDRFGVAINNRSKGLIDRTRNKAKEMSGNSNWRRTSALRKQARDSRKTEDYFGRMAGTGTLGGNVAKRSQRGWRGLAPVPIAAADKLLGDKATRDATNLQRIAREQSRKHFVDEVGRIGGDMTSAGAFSQGTKFEKLDAKGNVIAGSAHYDPGQALAEWSNGAKMKATNLNGKSMDFDTTGDHGVHGRNAAQRQAVKIADGNALGMMLYGKQHPTDPSKDVKALSDKNMQDFVTWFGENPGQLNEKTPHLLKKDNAFNAVNAQQMTGWHGTEYKAAAARIIQLEDAGRHTDALKAKNAINKAWADFGSDPTLSKFMNQDRINAFNDFTNVANRTINPATGAPYAPVKLQGHDDKDYL